MEIHSSLCSVYSMSIGVLGQSRYGVDHNQMGWIVSHPLPWLLRGVKCLVLSVTVCGVTIVIVGFQYKHWPIDHVINMLTIILPHTLLYYIII